MGVLPDWLIQRDIRISPFVPEQASSQVISYGVSAYGYDLRLSSLDFRVFDPIPGHVVNPKAFNPECLRLVSPRKLEGMGLAFTIPPHSYALGRSVEHIKMPRGTIGVCVGKSTYARCGIIVNVTPIEPGWEGILTIEISNSTPLPCVVFAEEGICQVLFLRGESLPRVDYAERKGKYQHQTTTTLPRVSTR
jgi:dCTP deaminase